MFYEKYALCILDTPNSPRASNTFNQVAEAKRFEGVFFCRKYAEFKNQTLKKSAGTQKSYAQRNTEGGGGGGVCNFSN